MWRTFSKTPRNRVQFNSFFNRFIEAGAVNIIQFDDTLEILIKKFVHVIKKFGDFFEAFKKIDVNNN